MTNVTVVIPSIGRSSLGDVLQILTTHIAPSSIVVVDDRPFAVSRAHPFSVPAGVVVLCADHRGPAGARNLGWRHARTPWIAFIDDDVLPDATWARDLVADLSFADDTCGAIQGRIRVELPKHRRPTDAERGVASLGSARWITADMAVRREALAQVGGFDERFTRAYREDTDLALRLINAGWRIRSGLRTSRHLLSRTAFWSSAHAQAGNADDMLMRRLHGPHWRSRAGVTPGLRRRHVATTATAGLAVWHTLSGHHTRAALAAGSWFSQTSDFFISRMAPGPRTSDEAIRMLATSVAIPPLATWHTVRGALRHALASPWQGPPDLVLFDRDGTLVVDVPYNGDPTVVRPIPGAIEAVRRLRREGIRTGVITNQSAVGRGLIDSEQLAAVNARVDDLFGGFDTWQICTHTASDECDCRKPKPGMVLSACADLHVPVHRCVVIGDIGLDVASAQAAGAHGVLVPTPATSPSEVQSAVAVEANLGGAVERVLTGRW